MNPGGGSFFVPSPIVPLVNQNQLPRSVSMPYPIQNCQAVLGNTGPCFYPPGFPSVHPLSLPSPVEQQLTPSVASAASLPLMSSSNIVTLPSNNTSSLPPNASLLLPPNNASLSLSPNTPFVGNGLPPIPSAVTLESTSPPKLSANPPPIRPVPGPAKAPGQWHSSPASIMLPPSQIPDIVSNPVPEFLCHLFTMVRDPSISRLISWSVPAEDEPDEKGGGIRGVGKIVVHDPEGLQNEVLGKYYRHSKYASFQRQMNYFGFKKRIHNGKKGKLSPCSYVHSNLGTEPHSLFLLKRRPPANKRSNPDDEGGAAGEEQGGEKPRKRSRSSNDEPDTPSGGNCIASETNQELAGNNFSGGCIVSPSSTNEARNCLTNKFVDGSCEIKPSMNQPVLNLPSMNQSSLNLPQANNFMTNPSGMPFIIQADNSFRSPVKSFQLPPTTVSANPGMPFSMANNMPLPKIKTPLIFSNETAASRASAVAREAQKSLERAYLKSKQEQEAQSLTNFAFSSCVGNQMNQHQDLNQRQQQPLMRNMTPFPVSTAVNVGDETLSKLLSTTLPSSDELFDDDFSAGSLSEGYIFEGGLQIADDGMLLP